MYFVRYIFLTIILFTVPSCRSTNQSDISDLLGDAPRREKPKGKRLLYINPPPGSPYEADFTESSFGFVLNKLVEPEYYPITEKPIPERQWNIMTYDCNHFANDAVKHLRDEAYVWVLAYTHVRIEKYQHWDMRNLLPEELEELRKDIPNPRFNRLEGKIDQLETWQEKYETLSRMVKDSGMHAGIVVKARKWITNESEEVQTQDVYAFIEPQQGTLIVDWPATSSIPLPQDTEVTRSLLHHMSSQKGYFGIVGLEGRPVFDPSELVKRVDYCGIKSKVAFDWKNPAYWIAYWNNKITPRNHCVGCCADKAGWANRNHHTGSSWYDFDEVYRLWYEDCRNICNIMFTK